MKKLKYIILLIALLAIIAVLNSCHQPKKEIKILVLGLDGLMPDAIEKAKTPHLHRLIMDGTSTMKARAVYPTSSGPNWSSMILGCGPDQHGIDENGWTLENRKIIPVIEKENGYSPSIFDVLKKAYPEERISGVFNWFTIANYFDATTPDTLIDVSSTEEAIDQILNELIVQNSMFVFSQIDHMDHAGHGLGFGSDAYHKDLETLDQEIGRLIDKLKEEGMYENTYIITLADHGGYGFGHGGKTMEEYSIPFIINGPHINKGKNTSEVVYTFDVAAIIASICDLEMPNHWIGSNIESAFGLANELLSDFSPLTIISEDSIDGGYSFLKCEVFNSEENIKYKIPKQSAQWQDYQGTLKLPLGDSIFASVFNENRPSKVSYYVKPYIQHKGNNSQVDLYKQPSQKYAAQGAQSITDGFISSNIAYNNKEWLGFHGDDLNTVIKLEQSQRIHSITMRFLENVKSWIFLPQSIKIMSSKNGVHYQEIASSNSPFEYDYENAAIQEIKMEFEAVDTKFIKIHVENYGTLPAWHMGAGEQAWLFIDEIIIE